MTANHVAKKKAIGDGHKLLVLWFVMVHSLDAQVFCGSPRFLWWALTQRRQGREAGVPTEHLYIGRTNHYEPAKWQFMLISKGHGSEVVSS